MKNLLMGSLLGVKKLYWRLIYTYKVISEKSQVPLGSYVYVCYVAFKESRIALIEYGVFFDPEQAFYMREARLNNSVVEQGYNVDN